MLTYAYIIIIIIIIYHYYYNYYINIINVGRMYFLLVTNECVPVCWNTLTIYS